MTITDEDLNRIINTMFQKAALEISRYNNQTLDLKKKKSIIYDVIDDIEFLVSNWVYPILNNCNPKIWIDWLRKEKIKMNVTGTINVFVKDFGGRKVFSTTVSRKVSEKEYKQKYLEVVFSKDVCTIEAQAKFKEHTCYKVEVEKGCILPDFYKNKNGEDESKFVLWIYKAKILGTKECSKNGLPF